MDTKAKLTQAAEHLFDRHGFTATGMDRLTQAAGMSSRTLYKHAGSKTALITDVLKARSQRFHARMMEANSVDALFSSLAEWMIAEGCRGCLFLRAYGETGGDITEIADVVSAHKAELLKKIQEIVAVETGKSGDQVLAEQILVLFEGATAAAIYRGEDAVKAARLAAISLARGTGA